MGYVVELHEMPIRDGPSVGDLQDELCGCGQNFVVDISTSTSHGESK